MNNKQFIESGNYLIDEVKARAEKGSPYFFNDGTMKFFSSRTSDLCWKVGEKIYFITSEADKGPHLHQGSARAWTVRHIDKDGDKIFIDTMFPKGAGWGTWTSEEKRNKAVTVSFKDEGGQAYQDKISGVDAFLRLVRPATGGQRDTGLIE